MIAEGAFNRPVAEPILEVRGLTREFALGGSRMPGRHRRQLHAVEDVEFDLVPGRMTALVGESGSGKSTVARLLARLDTPTRGTLRFRGEDVLHFHSQRELRPYRSQVQIVFQDPFGSLNPVKRVKHHLARPLKIHHIVPPGEVEQRVYELLDQVGLTPPQAVAEKYPHQLSGGQRQRVAIARALAVEPVVLLADEPISMLDVSIRMGILNLMLDLKEQGNIAFLYITHDIASARYVADEVLVMYAGQVVERGETEGVLQTPLHPYTKLLLSAVPNPATGLQNKHVEARGEVQAPIDPAPGCRFALRCPLATAACTATTPALLQPLPNHWARCSLLAPNSLESGRVSA